jgi:ATP-dependent helicase/nuclease subunit B
MDEDEVLFNENARDTVILSGQNTLKIPEALVGVERQLMLTKLVLARKKMTSDQALNLGLELARLLDQVHTERLSFNKLATLVPEEYADHWRETLEFLTILTETWPKVLKENNAVDAAERRNFIFDEQVRSWITDPPSELVIAAGSTGSIPSTADLLSCVSRLKNGFVVLPGLDKVSTKEAWEALKDSHPQFGMAHLLKHIGVEREDVKDWQKQDLCNVMQNRSHIIQAALTPANFKTPPLPDEKEIKIAIDGITHIECPTPREEAATIALMMRRALENPQQTAALVTPDRSLARRVASELSRWNIEIDDSAGIPLAQTPPGSFLRLIARMFSDDLAPASLLAALKHPLAAGGMSTQIFRNLVRDLEIFILRGPRPAQGIDGLLAAIKINADLKKEKKQHKEVKTLIRLRTFIKELQNIFKPFSQILDGSPKTLAEVVNQHVHLAEALARTEENIGADRIWIGDAGESAALFISEIINYGDLLEINAKSDYSAMLHSLMAGRVVRPRFGRHPRLNIWGPLEARLQQADLMILSGLNETVWPPEAKASPWMSYPMMVEFGLPTPERRIGLAAHDFTQAFCSPQIVLTRSLRVDGTPTVPSRWLLRLENLLNQKGFNIGSNKEIPWLKWIDTIDAPKEILDPRLAEPSPQPPVAARPRRLSVTKIETWLRDPYAIYAREILDLRRLEPLDAEPGAAERGIIIHKILEQFKNDYPDKLPEDAENHLLKIAQITFNKDLPYPGVRAFWWPRFERIANWFIAYEKNNHSKGYKTIATEVNGEMTIMGHSGDFKLKAIADRIDIDNYQGLTIIDYKTGSVPTTKQVETGLTPQLSLEAAIAKNGGFENIKAGPLSHLIYIQLSGGRVSGKANLLKVDPDEVADDALKQLTRLVVQFDDVKTPYLSSRKPMFQDRPSAYDHLARVKEWRGQTEDEE